MLDAHGLFQVIQDQLAQVEQSLLSIVSASGGIVADINTNLVQAGGKRLRPALYLLSARSGAAEAAVVIPMATALELIHMATLVHDDVIDEAAIRRGLPTANARWGNQTAVLTGDYLFARAFATVAGYASSAMLTLLAEVVSAMCEGEITQKNSTFDYRQSEEDYEARIAKKTANFMAACCRLGAMAAAAPPDVADALWQYGYNLGLAFQVTDDVLDITASEAQIGKPAGNDLREGVITLPVLYALAHSPYREELAACLRRRDTSEEAVSRCLEIIRACGAVAYSYRRADAYLARAKAALPRQLPADVYQALQGLADFVGARSY